MCTCACTCLCTGVRPKAWWSFRRGPTRRMPSAVSLREGTVAAGREGGELTGDAGLQRHPVRKERGEVRGGSLGLRCPSFATYLWSLGKSPPHSEPQFLHLWNGLMTALPFVGWGECLAWVPALWRYSTLHFNTSVGVPLFPLRALVLIL